MRRLGIDRSSVSRSPLRDHVVKRVRIHRRAVTLLELLVTVAATVVLTTILVITIRGVRGQSLTAMNINNLRMSAQDFYA